MRETINRNLQELFAEAREFGKWSPGMEECRQSVRKLLTLTNSLQTRLGILDAHLEALGDETDG